jgi:hypothetical protein
VRLVLEAREQEPDASWTSLYKRVDNRIGVPLDTLRTWVRRHQIDIGQRTGTTGRV